MVNTNFAVPRNLLRKDSTGCGWVAGNDGRETEN